jgi:hypothetical protein
MRIYELYLKTTGEVLATGYNSFAAVNNYTALSNKYGNSEVGIRWHGSNSNNKPMKPILCKDKWGEDADGNRGEEFTYFECPSCGNELIGEETVCECCGQKIDINDNY